MASLTTPTPASASASASTSEPAQAGRKVRVALLLCDTPIPAVQAEDGSYLDIFRTWLQGSLDTYPDRTLAASVSLEVTGFDVVGLEFPPLEGFGETYDVLMLTGAKHDAHDVSIPFIRPLRAFVRTVANTMPHIKLVGVCFGHQTIALALGGQSGRGGAGWEVGVYRNEATELGRQVWGRDEVYVQQMHRDCVSSLPPSFHPLLRSSKYTSHSALAYHPLSTPTSPLIQILTIQGHPEFTPRIVRHLIDARGASGVLSSDEVREARRRAGGKDGETGGEGLGPVGWAIWRVMLGELPRVDVDVRGRQEERWSEAKEEERAVQGSTARKGSESRERRGTTQAAPGREGRDADSCDQCGKRGCRTVLAQ